MGVMIAGCSDRGAEIPSGESPYEPFIQYTPVTVVPDSGRIGATVAVTDSDFRPSYRYAVVFRGTNEPLLITCDSSSTIHAFVPFSALTGPISVCLPGGTWITQTFVVTESSDTTTLAVAPYDILPPVTSADASVTDRMGFPRSWQASVSGDTVHLSRGYSTGDEYYEYHFVLIARGAQQLPRMAGAWIFVQPDYPGSWRDTIRTGVMKLQDWNPAGVISGRFFGRPSLNRMLNGSTAFWLQRGG